MTLANTRLHHRLFVLSVSLLVITFVQISPAVAGALSGHMYNARTEGSIAYATVQAIGTGKSTSTNGDGEYRLVLRPGHYTIKFSHIGFFSETTEVDIADSSSVLDVRLQPTLIEIPGMKVFDKAYDPAQEIIVEAIRRKKDILSMLHDFQYDAYTKFVLWDDTKQDSSKIFLIAESQTTAFWEQPDKYKEIITARRQTANVGPEGNLISVGEILNFNKNRIDINEYSIVSPTATDALDHYNYTIDDTVYIDSQRVFVLDVEPKSETDPLFVGQISIVDSTFDVVAVDVGFNKAVRFPFVENARYMQHMAEFNNEYWMPIEIRFGGNIVFNMVPPGIPSRLSFDYVASLYSYSFEKGIPSDTFDEYQLVVEPEADDYDSLTWESHQTIPLTMEEEDGYERIDSLEQKPPSVRRVLAMSIAGAMYLMTGGEHDIFHYNRVEGPYLGLGGTLKKLIPETELHAAVGYAFEAEKWQYGFGLDRQVWKKKHLRLGAEFHDQVVHRSAIGLSQNFNASFEALFYKADPLEYYVEKGFSLETEMRPLSHFTTSMTLRDLKQSSIGVNTDYAFFDEDEPTRPNPAIADGDLRSLSFGLNYDSRKLMNNKGVDIPVFSLPYTVAAAQVEYSSHDFLSSDFDFRRYDLSISHRRRTFGLGITSLYLYLGGADGPLPPQRYYTVAFGDPVFTSAMSFKTLDRINFVGNQVAAFYGDHDFGRRLFEMSHLPLIKKIPLDLSVHGGVFWTDFRGGVIPGDGENALVARAAYSELGFGVGNLTPFLSPFNFALSFTWQLSHYSTDTFSWQMGIKF